ncbi:hypothetical protein DXG03_009746 [Asterophora parasitica]|uniref:FAD dependent oxidoreductase domain-containing protein n=1 Tax=Asterophora parasitica TaxID=117018 RepID=A0A9P7G415_9AGAR|nr:hypothetical protein DXG03_009746 [Asterophora parasitica]
MGAEDRKNVVVLGAGVVGLTTAVKIQELGGFNVSIVADVLPTDEKTTKYTSFWAMDLETFKVMWELSEPGTETAKYFMRIEQTEYYTDFKYLPPLDRMPNFKVLAQEALPEGIVHGSTFSTLTIDTPNYLPYLARRLVAAGGQLVRGSVQHIDQVLEGGAGIFLETNGTKTPQRPDAVVVCTGLGTRFLGGVEDKAMHPIRGQTVLVRAPWINFGRTIGNGTSWTYVIARHSGDVILGGTRAVDDWYPLPRPEATRDILERTFAMCPELAPPEVRTERTPTLDDVLPLVIEEGCGFRPGRTGGIRLDVEWRVAGSSAKAKAVPVVFNYGYVSLQGSLECICSRGRRNVSDRHGGYGFQSSWGSADIAARLLEEAISGEY